MEDKMYWFITVLEYIEEDDLGWPKFGTTRCWGFYTIGLICGKLVMIMPF